MSTMKNPITVTGGGGSSDVVNGIIEQYKASNGTIDANTFVEFVNNGEKTAEYSTDSSAGQLSAVALDDTTVFIAYAGSRYSYVTGMICTISGDTIMNGTTVVVSSTSASGGISAVYMMASKVLIVYRKYSSSSADMYAVVCTISGDTITVGTISSVYSNNYAGEGVAAVRTSSISALVLYGRSASGGKNYLYGCTCSTTSTTSTTISVGTQTNMTSTPYTGVIISAVRLDSGDYFIAHRYGSSTGSVRLYGVIVTSATSSGVTCGTDTLIANPGSNTGTLRGFSAATPSSSGVFIAYYGDAYGSVLYGVACSIASSTITAGTQASMADSYSYSTVIRNGRPISTIKLSNNRVLTVFNGRESDKGIVCSLICDVDGTSFSVETNSMVERSDDSSNSQGHLSLSAVLVDSDKIFIAYNDLGGNAAVNRVGLLQPKLVESSTLIDGLTATACSDTTAGNVWVLNTSESE